MERRFFSTGCNWTGPSSPESRNGQREASKRPEPLGVHVGVVKVFPIDAADVQVAHAVGGQIGHFDFEDVFSWLEELAHIDLPRGAPDRAHLVPVEFDARRSANPTQSEHPIIGLPGGMIEVEEVTGGAGKALGFGVVAGGAGNEVGGGEGGGQLRAAFHKFERPRFR